MSKPFASGSPANRSQKGASAHDIQRGVTGPEGILWPFEAITERGVQTAAVDLPYCFLNGTLDKIRSVCSVIEPAQKPANSDFVTWMECANVRFHVVDDPTRARVRITFQVDGDGFWSVLGTKAQNIDNYPPGTPTMWLPGLPNEYPPTEKSRRHILHEFGHILGLEHEHQSPAREGVINLHEYTMRQFPGGEVNYLNVVQHPINYTQIDLESIMLYGIPRDYQSGKKAKDIPAPMKLSVLDQAFIRLMYPPDLSNPDNLELLREAMLTARIPNDTAGQILAEFRATDAPLVDRLTAVRDSFNAYRGRQLRLWEDNVVARMINPAALKRPDIKGVAQEVSKDKLYKAIVKNIVYRSGIPTKVSMPGSTQTEVMRMLGALAMHDDFGRSVKYYDSQLSKATS